MRGEFEFSGSGTFRTGGSGIVAVMVAAVVVILALEWIAARIWWILGGTAVLAVAVFLAVRWLLRYQEGREAAFAARRRAPRELEAEASPQVRQGTRPPAIVNHYHNDVHLHVAPGADVSSLIRALPVQGNAATEEE